VAKSGSAAGSGVTIGGAGMGENAFPVIAYVLPLEFTMSIVGVLANSVKKKRLLD
jgi:hypothetical protein